MFLLTRVQISQYYTSGSPISPITSAQTTGKAAIPPPADVKVDIPPSASERAVTPQAHVDESLTRREEKVEYRDQEGNLLNEEQVKALAGKVSFSTRYETRTRILDPQGNEIDYGQPGVEAVAPPHPDAEQEPNTKGKAVDSESSAAPAIVSPESDLAKKKAMDDAKSGMPRPASENLEATK